jgi:hypothetical protein
MTKLRLAMKDWPDTLIIYSKEDFGLVWLESTFLSVADIKDLTNVRFEIVADANHAFDRRLSQICLVKLMHGHLSKITGDAE